MQTLLSDNVLKKKLFLLKNIFIYGTIVYIYLKEEIMSREFLPVTMQEAREKNIEQFDFIVVCADAYVDHSSFGHAIIARILEDEGFTVGIIPQPDWHNTEDFKRLGRPKYAFMVSTGNIDSMVCHYTASKKKRNDDRYSPGGKAGFRPDRPGIVYTNRLKEAFPNVDVIIGGLEASLRRFAHYDYWDNKVRNSILIDSGADLLSYGMGELQTREIARRLKKGVRAKDITDIPGTCYLSDEKPEGALECCTLSEVKKDKRKYARAFMMQYENQNPYISKTIAQKHNNKFVVVNRPMRPLTRQELDKTYSLPFVGTYHPMYEKDGGIPAIEEVKFSITSSRGCFGNCNFCALAFHQGRIITSRSEKSILKEAKRLIWEPDFKGYIHDVGGPTANFRKPSCKKQNEVGACTNKQCLFPTPCKNLEVDHKEYAHILNEIRNLPKVKKVFVRSGIRFDYLVYDKDDSFFKQLCEHHVSGQLKVAPEHISDNVLKYMGKPSRNVYEKFVNKYFEICKSLNKEQYVVPYLMSSHPGSILKDAIMLAEYLRDIKYSPEQVQDFYPTPGTMSTCMFYTELDPRTMEKVYVPKTYEEKKMQRALLQYRRPENYEIVKKALVKAGRTDLIGFSEKCLIKPRIIKGGNKNGTDNRRKSSVSSNKRGNEKRVRGAKKGRH